MLFISDANLLHFLNVTNFITIVLKTKKRPSKMRSFQTQTNKFKINSLISEARTYKISIDAFSLDVKQSAKFQLNKDIIVKKVQPVFKAEKEFSDLKSKN